MKRTIWAAVLVVVVALWLATLVSAAGPQSYPMVCRGGGGMRIDWHGARAVTGRSSTPYVTIQFAKAGTAASASQPGPGQCAWLDRPLNAREPSRLRIEGDVIYFLLRPGGTAEVNFIPTGVNNVVRAALRGGVFYVHANNSHGVLVVTRVGP